MTTEQEKSFYDKIENMRQRAKVAEARVAALEAVVEKADAFFLAYDHGGTRVPYRIAYRAARAALGDSEPFTTGDEPTPFGKRADAEVQELLMNLLDAASKKWRNDE
jgi:hypothetical protein